MLQGNQITFNLHSLMNNIIREKKVKSSLYLADNLILWFIAAE